MEPTRRHGVREAGRRGRGPAVLAVALLLVLGGPLLSGCAAGGTDSLTGTTWYLVSGGERTPAWEWTVPADLQTSYTIRFEKDGSFGAQADCNRLGGAWEARGSDRLTITPGPMTMATCGERSLDILYAGTLGQVRNWTVASTGMTLTLADGGRLDYTSVAPAGPTAAPTPDAEKSVEPTDVASSPVPTATRTVTATATTTVSAPQPSATTAPPTPRPTPTPSKSATPSPEPTHTPEPGPGLTGRTWQLTAFTLVTPPFEGQVPQAQRASYTIEFGVDGSFTAQADCNSVRGTYAPANPSDASGSLTLSPGPVTLVACDEGSYSELYLTGLASTASFRVEGATLRLGLSDSGELEYR